MSYYYSLITMKKVEVDNVIAMIEKPINDGRIIGLSKWNNKKGIVIITEGEAGK